MKELSLNWPRAFLVCFVLLLACGACNGKIASGEEDSLSVTAGDVAEKPAALPGALVNPGELSARLEQIAEIERAGGFFPGLGLTESGLREKAGDFAGAAVAAFKELSWAYGLGGAGMEQMAERLTDAISRLEENSQVDAVRREEGASTLRGCIAFAEGAWEEAGRLLSKISLTDEEPDSFLRWMILVCDMEQGKNAGAEGRKNRSAYGAIRARYALFPEYWYRGARAFSGKDADETGGNISAGISTAYAEQCVNISPKGPFAAECREIIFTQAGLSAVSPGNNCSDIRTKTEIENIIRSSVEANNPQILEELFPLMALPDNPYTVYAQGALKVLSSLPAYREFFNAGALKSSGRLEERLRYISRG